MMENEPKTRREREVWGACDALYTLHGEFEKLTGDNLRDQLLSMGHKKGSPNEVYRYRKSWTLARGILAEKDGESAQKTDDPITRAVGLVHEQLKAESQNELERIRKNYEDTIESLTLRRDELEELAAGQAEELGALKLESRGQKSEIRDLNRKLGELSEENIVLETKVKELGLHLKQNQDYFKGLKHTIAAAHTHELEELRKAHKSQAEEAKKTIQALKAELKTLGTNAMDESNALKSDIKAASAKLDQANKKLSMVESHRAALEGELKAVKADFKAWIGSQTKMDANFEKWAGRWHQVLLDSAQKQEQARKDVQKVAVRNLEEIKKLSLPKSKRLSK